MGDKPRRLRVNRQASITRDDPSMRDFVGGQLLVRVAARVIFPNSPATSLLLRMERPPSMRRTNYEPPEPAWKQRQGAKDKLPPLGTCRTCYWRARYPIALAEG